MTQTGMRNIWNIAAVVALPGLLALAGDGLAQTDAECAQPLSSLEHRTSRSAPPRYELQR